jgi:membrane protein required for beta-lactamase induction
VSDILSTVWDRFQIIGRVNGDYIARFFATLFYYIILIPFALIARFAINPLDTHAAKPTWKTRKAVGATLDDARSQS